MAYFISVVLFCSQRERRKVNGRMLSKGQIFFCVSLLINCSIIKYHISHFSKIRSMKADIKIHMYVLYQLFLNLSRFTLITLMHYINPYRDGFRKFNSVFFEAFYPEMRNNRSELKGIEARYISYILFEINQSMNYVIQSSY